MRDNITGTKNITGSKLDIYVTWGVTLLIFLILIVIAFIYNDHKYLTQFLLCGVLGASIGWLLGFMATPYSRVEERKLTIYAKLIYSFLTGYVLGKVDNIISHYVDQIKTPNFNQELLWMCLSVLVCSIIVAFICTFINRTYWLPRSHHLNNDKG